MWCAPWRCAARSGRRSASGVAPGAGRGAARQPLHRGQPRGRRPRGRAGLRRREAQARCPSIELHDRDEQREARLFEVVLGELEQIAARLEVLEAGRCAWPPVGPSRYHGGDRCPGASWSGPGCVRRWLEHLGRAEWCRARWAWRSRTVHGPPPSPLRRRSRDGGGRAGGRGPGGDRRVPGAAARRAPGAGAHVATRSA